MTNRVLAFLLATLASLAVRTARAETCPDLPSDTRERRTLAKEWFSRAETAERAGDQASAARAYACSMRMVPHADTAYNLGRAAEKAGDLDAALASYRNYLTLKPEAPDKADVESRIKNLEARIAAVRSALPDTTATTSAPPPPPADPPRPAATPAATVATAAAREPAAPPSAMGVTEWVIAGVGTAALVAGVVFNLGARSKMNDCRSLADANKIAAARDACDAAKPFAYSSYALFGVAGAAAAIDLVMVLTNSSSSDSKEKLGMTLLPGGAALTLGGRF